jgi:hypothetical protein
MYIQKKRHNKSNRGRSAKKNAKLKAKNRRRKLRKSGLPH